MIEQLLKHPSLVQAQNQADQKADIQELKRKQINGEIKKIPANKAHDLGRDASEYEGYHIWETEKDFYHLLLMIKHWQDDIRDILWEQKVISYTPREFSMAMKDPVIKGHDVQIILHDPTIKDAKKPGKKEVSETLKAARAHYEELTGKKAGNKKEETLIAEVNKILDKQNEES